MSLLIRFFGVTALAAFICALVRRGNPAALFEYEVVGCVLIGALGSLLIGASQEEWSSAWAFLVGRGHLTDARRLSAARWFQIGRRGVLASGAVTYAVGVIVLLSNLSSPMMLGWGLATALLAVVYALMLSEFFFFPFAAAASHGLTRPTLDKAALPSTLLVVTMITGPVALLFAVL